MAVASRETVLPSGAFARCRALTGADMLDARRLSAAGSDLDMMFCFIMVAVRIDDKPVTYKQLLEMDIRDISVLQDLVMTYIKGPIR